MSHRSKAPRAAVRLNVVRLIGTGAAVVALGAVGALSALSAPPTHDRSHPSIPVAKQQALRKDQELLARERAARPAKPIGRPSPQPEAPRVGGIIPVHQGPVPAFQFLVQNAYAGEVGGRWLIVYAGATRDGNGPVRHGALTIYTAPVDPNAPGPQITFVGTFLAPVGPAPVTVIGVRGSVLILQTDTGKHLLFDMSTERYSTSSG